MEFLLTLRRRGISDQAVLRAMDEVPRDRFVDVSFANSALEQKTKDNDRMTVQLAVRSHHRVLEVGTGSGYQAAVLSRLAREVVSIERYRTLADAARERLKSLGYKNVEIVVGDGFAGVPDRAPYDRIIVTAAAETLPQMLVDQLAEDGIMILPLGSHEGAQHLIKLTKSQTGTRRENMIAVRFVPMLPGQAEEL